MLEDDTNITGDESPQPAEHLEISTAPSAKTPRPHYKPKNTALTSFLISLGIHGFLLAIVVAVVIHYSTGQYANKGFFTNMYETRFKKAAVATEDSTMPEGMIPPMSSAGFMPSGSPPAMASQTAEDEAMFDVPLAFSTPASIQWDSMIDEPYLWGVNPSAGIGECPIRHVNPANDSSK